MTSVQLTGLKGHHPLGFLAGCGVLRLCPEAQLSWVYQTDSSEYIARLEFKHIVNNDERKTKRYVVAMLIRGARRHALTLGWWREAQKITMTASTFRKKAAELSIAEGDFHGSSNFLSSLASDIVVGKDHQVTPTLFDCTSGNQRILKSLLDLTISLAKNPTKRTRTHQQMTTPREAFEEAIFGPWLYRDNQHSLGWDPQTQRLHALLRMDPSIERNTQGIPGVRAAVFLASQALPLFPSFAVGHRLRTTGFRQDKTGDYFSWPIWTNPISLDTLPSLLALPFSNEMRRRGVKAVYRCQRVRTGGSEGNYQVFSHAEEWPWPRESLHLQS